MQRSLSATTLALVCAMVITPPLMAQSRSEDSRFQVAQQRLNNELALFGTEFNRYQQARSRNWQDNRRDRDDPREYG